MPSLRLLLLGALVLSGCAAPTGMSSDFAFQADNARKGVVFFSTRYDMKCDQGAMEHAQLLFSNGKEDWRAFQLANFLIRNDFDSPPGQLQIAALPAGAYHFGDVTSTGPAVEITYPFPRNISEVLLRPGTVSYLGELTISATCGKARYSINNRLERDARIFHQRIPGLARAPIVTQLLTTK